MNWYLAFVLVCLFLAAPAGAVTVSSKLGTTLSVKELVDVSCSDDVFAPYPNATVIWVVYLSGNGDTYIDGVGKMPMYGETLGGKPGFQYFVTSGTHKVLITRAGYSNYSATVAACSGKVSYVYYDLTAHVITTTAVTTTGTTVAVTTIQPSMDSAPTSVTTVTTAGTTAAIETSGALSVTTTPAGAYIFIDGVQRGVSPAVIPGLSAGSHTVLLKLDGYQDLSVLVTIQSGVTQDYATGLVKASATTSLTPSGTVVATSIETTATGAGTMPVTTAARSTAAPGFGVIAGLSAVMGFLLIRKYRS